MRSEKEYNVYINPGEVSAKQPLEKMLAIERAVRCYIEIKDKEDLEEVTKANGQRWKYGRLREIMRLGKGFYRPRRG